MAEDYISLMAQVLEDESLSKKEKTGFLFILQTLLKKAGVDFEQLEAGSYMTGKKPLSDGERIAYECNRLYRVEDDGVRQEVRKLLYTYKRGIPKERDRQAKKQLTLLQIKEGITPSFYSVFGELIEELKEKEPPKVHEK